MIEYPFLAEFSQVLAYFLPEAPTELLEIFNETAKEVIFSIFPKYGNIVNEIFVRIADLPLSEDIRTLRL